MKSTSQAVALIRSPWTGSLQGLLSIVEQDLLIACPFVKRFAIERILTHLSSASFEILCGYT